MSPGRLIAVVGPSGVGKDSLMAAMVAADPRLRLVQRVITRAPDLGGEDYIPLSVEAFEKEAERGAFCLHWGAHGLHYGIPREVETQVRAGAICLANLSRSALTDAARVFARLTVLNITASPDVLATRLAARGRETPEEIAKRLHQRDKPLPAGLDVITIRNDGPLADTAKAALSALQPASV